MSPMDGFGIAFFAIWLLMMLVSLGGIIFFMVICWRLVKAIESLSKEHATLASAVKDISESLKIKNSN